MSLRSVQRSAAARYGELGSDLSSTLRPQKPVHRTSELPTTTRLLRNSRLFSLPKPLRRPDIAQVGGLRSTYESDTATLPYPTHAAIVTHAKSFGRGDWGLKRQLPTKAFKTTTPVVRVKHVDTIDHITEFESAADHVFTLQKVQELGVAVTIPKARDQRTIRNGGQAITVRPPTSAFEDFTDPKDIPEAHLSSTSSETQGPKGWGVDVAKPTTVRRWHYDSPWIAGMPRGKFEQYIRSTIKNKRAEFRAWLRTKLADKRSQSATSGSSLLNVDSGIAATSTPESQQTASNIVAEVAIKSVVPAEDTLEEDILDLRNHPEELYKYVWEFFDLPGRLPSLVDQNMANWVKDNVDVELGPPTTHPSAGLSYLRPVNQLYNHAALGPMAQAPPVPARILQRSGHAGRKDSPQIIGVAGVATEPGRTEFRSRDRDARSDPAHSLHGLKIPGGPKLWAHVKGAEITSKGSIRFNLGQAADDEVAVWYPQPSARSRNAEARTWGAAKRQATSQSMPDLTNMPNYRKIDT